jgi:hypothetical protein
MEKIIMSEEELKNLYISVLDVIHVKLPKTRVYIVEYLCLLGDGY